ncbi:uncharacterized protein B0I36DRAFT_353187 [Microdochium trichocladiopsis]|uniref:Uncharacterized protein n=1 Tax=Microdochium trichocladiopsis TaxID=1682393 RepID=A0A9P8Y1A6_9PEZI|nr:uncharacterized protein B0I36DRAFT_353187 [Microdochium trichocladiopsis]KAH7025011.1 hypothetical protein B0I36DRAFT_353187 [Microdochium trichocladiopsis]
MSDRSNAPAPTSSKVKFTRRGRRVKRGNKANKGKDHSTQLTLDTTGLVQWHLPGNIQKWVAYKAAQPTHNLLKQAVSADGGSAPRAWSVGWGCFYRTPSDHSSLCSLAGDVDVLAGRRTRTAVSRGIPPIFALDTLVAPVHGGEMAVASGRL